MWTGSDGDEGIAGLRKGIDQLYFGRCGFSKLVSGNPPITEHTCDFKETNVRRLITTPTHATMIRSDYCI